MERGVAKVIGGDPKGNNFLYTNGKSVIIRNIEVICLFFYFFISLAIIHISYHCTLPINCSTFHLLPHPLGTLQSQTFKCALSKHLLINNMRYTRAASVAPATTPKGDLRVY